MTFEEALRVLGVAVGTDSDDVRASYLARAREIALSSDTDSGKAAANERLEAAYTAYLAGPTTQARQVPETQASEPRQGAPAQYYVPAPARPRRRWGCGVWLLLLIAVVIGIGAISAAVQSMNKPGVPSTPDSPPAQITPSDGAVPGSGTQGQTGLVGSCWAIDGSDSSSVRQVDCSATTVDFVVTSETTSSKSCASDYMDNQDGYFLCLSPK
jgi:hypothetical protein